MTEWNGIKVGGLLKQTGRGSRGAPLLLVTALDTCGVCSVDHPIVTVLVDDREVSFDLDFDKWENHFVQIDQDDKIKPWPYKVVV